MQAKRHCPVLFFIQSLTPNLIDRYYHYYINVYYRIMSNFENLVSIIIPTFKAEHSIYKLCKELLNIFSNHKIEIIIVKKKAIALKSFNENKLVIFYLNYLIQSNNKRY